MTSKFPARLHVLMAPRATRAVVIRRGPSRHVCTVDWNRNGDSFSVGQWLKGRIYERRSDLSPDGRHLLYFAMNGRWSSETKGSWTALSRAPYLKAVGLWAKGDCWHGGGLFTGARTYWLNDGYGHAPLVVPSSLERVMEYPNYTYYGGECTGVYYLRLQRDGWTLVGMPERVRFHTVTVFEKRVDRRWTLRKYAYATIERPQGKGCYFDRHELEHAKTGALVDGAEWEWAEVDRGRLVWAEGGRLFAGRLGAAGLERVEELWDFNEMAFERIEAPY